MNNKKYYCTSCEKYYKTSQSLCNHKRIYHMVSPVKSFESPVKSFESPAKSFESPIIISNKIYTCKFCNKIYNNKNSKWSHQNKCKFIIPNQIANIKEELKEELKKDIINDILKNCKIHPKTLQKINKQLINNNNNITNNINNGTINNINIVKFGSENIKDILNEKEIMKIFSSWYNAIEESIKEVHFNKSRPEYRNILITNLRDNIAYVYNGNKFEAVQKQSVISELIDKHVNNIEVSLENYKHKLPKKTANILDKLLEKLEDDESKITDENNKKEYKNFKSYKTNEIKLMIYNESRKNMEVIKFQL
jgi:hypothetical protein